MTIYLESKKIAVTLQRLRTPTRDNKKFFSVLNRAHQNAHVIRVFKRICKNYFGEFFKAMRTFSPCCNSKTTCGLIALLEVVYFSRTLIIFSSAVLL